MNFPNATAEDWTHAAALIAAGACRAGYCQADADDMAQHAMLSIMKRTYTRGMPESPAHAARIIRRGCQRYGWHILRPADNLARQRRPEIVEGAEVYRKAVHNTRAASPCPATMAEEAERTGQTLRRVQEAYGIGPGALAEPGHTPSVYGSGPATPTPVAGSRLSRLETDPNPERTLAATHPGNNPPQWREMDDDYRQALATYYAGR